MRLICIPVLFVLLFIVLACNTGPKRETKDPSGGLKKGFTWREALGGCDTTATQGVSVVIRMWEPSDSSEAAAKIRSQLLRKVVERINAHADSASIASSPGAKNSLPRAYKIFSNNYTDFKKDFPDAPGCWEVDLKGDTLMVTKKIIIYQLDHYAFTGGAHPNSFKSLHVFDGSTGLELAMKNFISDTTALLQKVEIAFRKEEKLAADANFEKEGYFLENNRFFLPSNYAFTQAGVLFYYNPYEIAPYAKGAIAFTVSYKDLGGIVLTNLIF